MKQTTIEEKYEKFKLSNDLRDQLNNLSDLDFTKNKGSVSLNVETHLINYNNDRIINREIINVKLV